MKAVLHVVNATDAASELRSLRASLLFEEALTGRVEVVTTPDDFATGQESLIVTLQGDAAAALARATSAWIQHRDAGLRLRVMVEFGASDVTEPATASDLLSVLQQRPPDDAAPPQTADDPRRYELIAAIEQSMFKKPPFGKRGYDEDAVDQFLDKVVTALRGHTRMSAESVRTVQFGKPPRGRRGYDEEDVDVLLDQIQRALAALQ